MKRFNKGEWSEIYAVLKTIADKSLFLCDANLKLTGEIVPVLAGALGNKEYQISEGNLKVNNENHVISLPDIQLFCDYLFQKISSSEGVFNVDLETFSSILPDENLKSNSSKKQDTNLTIFDELLKDYYTLGFSVKSFTGSNPSLVNASKATNFTYFVDGAPCLKELKTKELVRSLKESNISLKLETIDSKQYQSNLMQVDLLMPNILAEMLKIYYGYSAKYKYIRNIIKELRILNPLNLTDLDLYDQKIADFLFSSAVGLFPTKPYDMIDNIDGECILVLKTGELKTFYIIRKSNLKEFRNYLIQHSYLETASTSRHKFGKLYTDDDQLKLKLNLQVRIER